MKYVIYSGQYDDDSGGIVVLHQLCHLLNEAGEDARLWPFHKPVFDYHRPVKSLFKWLKYYRKKRPFAVNPAYNTPVATHADLHDAVIVYPEIVDGNPLGGKNVVRWFLHKPGYHKGYYQYGKNELFFYYLKAYDNTDLTRGEGNLLHINMLRKDIYRQTNFDEREGTCYILRKGKKRPIVHDLSASICIDGLSHAECAKIFNQTKYCISYDTYTMYSVYATLCGCISIVLPEEGVSKEEWLPDETKRFGLAYGFDDIEYALQTRTLLLEALEEDERQTRRNVAEFILKCKASFSSNEPA